MSEPDVRVVNAVEEIQSLANQITEKADALVEAVNETMPKSTVSFELQNILSSTDEIRENLNDFKEQYLAETKEKQD